MNVDKSLVWSEVGEIEKDCFVFANQHKLFNIGYKCKKKAGTFYIYTYNKLGIGSIGEYG